MRRLSAVSELVEVVPVLQRAAAVDPTSLARVRAAGRRVTLLIRLPFAALAARSVALGRDVPEPVDVTVRAGELLAWLDGDAMPAARDAEWRWGSPPATGWRRVDTVPGHVVHDLVRKGARALDEAGDARQQVADTLLDSVVLTVAGDDDATQAEVSLRTLGALTRMGFLPRDAHVAVDVAGRWTRVASAYGSVYAERAGAALSLL